MQKILAALSALIVLSVCSASGGPKWVDFEVSHGTTSTNILTQTRPLIGDLDEVYVAIYTNDVLIVAGGVVTADLFVAVSPPMASGLSSTDIYTNSAVTGVASARPRVPQTDSEGTDLTTLTVAERYRCIGDRATLRVEQVSAVTGTTYRVWLKLIE